MEYIIGVDFDNTIISYDGIMHRVALEKGLIHPGIGERKKDIRDAIRRLPGGEIEWQRLQAMVYGPRIGEARLIEGVQTFFRLCKQNGVRVYTISHKTEFANYDETGTNLRLVALEWMTKNGFFDEEGWGLTPVDVYFESTRKEKIARVTSLGCTHFIDDLEETFLEDSFPTSVNRILYSPGAENPPLSGAKVVSTWEEISVLFFHAKS